MWTKLTVLACLLVTIVVVHTAVRIEHLNHQMGTFLPRAPGLESRKWEVPKIEHGLNFVDAQIAKQRVNIFVAEHPGEEVPPTESFVGGPYNESEQRLINRFRRDHATFSALHWWVYSFGAVQYGLAPLAFVWSVGNLLALDKLKIRILSMTCAGLAAVAIFLMIVRGY